MLLHHARRPARTRRRRQLVPLDEQDRSRWDTSMIAEGVDVLQAALARDRLGEYQAQAAIAALHDDAPAPTRPTGRRSSAGTTSCRAHREPGRRAQPGGRRRPGRRPRAGLAALADVDPGLPRHTAAAAYLHEKAGDLPDRGEVVCGRPPAPNLPERHHLTRQAARLTQALRR